MQVESYTLAAQVIEDDGSRATVVLVKNADDSHLGEVQRQTGSTGQVPVADVPDVTPLVQAAYTPPPAPTGEGAVDPGYVEQVGAQATPADAAPADTATTPPADVPPADAPPAEATPPADAPPAEEAPAQEPVAPEQPPTA